MIKEFGILYIYDEVGYIVIYIYSGWSGWNNNYCSICEVMIVFDIIYLVELELEIDIYLELFLLNYLRLVNYLWLFL